MLQLRLNLQLRANVIYFNNRILGCARIAENYSRTKLSIACQPVITQARLNEVPIVPRGKK